MKTYGLTAAAVAAALLMQGCSADGDNKDHVTCPPADTRTVVLDFEDAPLGTAEYEGFTPALYDNVLEGKSLASLCSDEGSLFFNTMFYEGVLYGRDGVNICTMYNDGEWMGYGLYDSWSGFAVSSNCDVDDESYTNQFSIWDTANGSNKFAVGYDAPGTGMHPEGVTYDTPAILLDTPGVVQSIDFMNTTYAAGTIASVDADAVYVLKVTGYLGSRKTGTVYVTLAEGGSIAGKWFTADTGSLGTVDMVTIQGDMDKCASAVQKPDQWMPLFFCIDNIKVLFTVE